MSLVAIHSRDIRHAHQTLGARTNRFRRRKDRNEICRAMEDVAETFGLRRLARLAGKIGGVR